ncbi:MAG: hypothetical protein WA532_11610 [Candidatus Korobacteraceae bacterium]
MPATPAPFPAASIVSCAKLETVIRGLLVLSVGGNYGNSHGPDAVGSGFREEDGLQLVFGSLPVAQTIHHDERNKRYKHQNGRHCHLLRVLFVLGSP